MSKKSSILMLLMALFAPWAANAQQTVTIGDATTSNPTLPVHMVYSYSLTQQIYTAEEIGVDGNITSIAFYHNPSTALTMEDIQVYMMQVEKSVFASNSDIVPLTDATKVFEGTLSANGTGWVPLQLSTPFPYDGESNLLVCCYDPNSSKPGSSQKFNTTSTGDNYTSLEYYSNSVIPNVNDVSSYTGSRGYYKYRNNIQLVIAPSDCQKPSTLVANGYTLTWTEGSGTYNVEYRKTSETNWTRAYTDLAATTCTLTLDPNTDYEARVQSVCSGDETSGWRTLSFATPCSAVTIDATHSWSEGFESYNEGTGTDSGAEVTDIRCWERVQINSNTNSPYVYCNYSAAASTGLASLELKTSSSTAVMVALPEFSEAIENLNVAFNYNCTSTSYTYTAELGYISDVTNANTFVKLFDIPKPVTRSTGHSEYSQDLYEAAAAANAPAGSRVAIKFATTTDSTPSWNFDDFMVSYVSPCHKPTGLTVVANSITSHTATLTWDAEPGATFQWHINGTTWTDTQNNTVELTGLTADHDYTFTLRKKCGNNDFSPEVAVNFTTAIACPAPTNLIVSNVSAHTATASWTGSSSGYNVYLGSLGPNGNVLNVNFNNGIPSNWNNSSSYPWIVTDGYIMSGNAGVASSTSSISVTTTFPADGTVEFDAECRGEGTSTFWDHCDFIIDGTTQFSYGANISGWNHYTFDVTAGQHTFTWSYSKDSSMNPTGDYFAIDNVVMVAANIVWGDPIYVENTEYTFSGLSSESRYFVKVESNCGNEGVSTEVGTSFNTDVACMPPTNLHTTEVTAHEAVLHWDGNAESYNVSYYKTFFFDNFEEGLSQWTIYNEGEDGSTGWSIDPPYDSSAVLNAYSGDFAAVAYSENSHADSWLVTPQIQFPNQATLKFWIMRSTYDDAQDEYEVHLSTTGNAITDFTTVLKEKAAANSTWTEVSIDLSEYDGQQGYIAIRHDFTNGFFLMVDDFGIYGWSEPIATTADSLLIEDLLPETEYVWKVQANCGDEDGMSQWSINNFTTLSTCPVPFNLTTTEVTLYGVTLDWTGLSDSYQVMIGELVGNTISNNFEDHTIPSTWTNNSTYPWTVVSGGQNGSYCIQSGNAGVHSSTSSISFTMNLTSDGTIDFDAQCMGEGASYDVCKFLIDNTTKFTKGANGEQWDHYSYEVTAGEHTFTWSYTKDSSVNPTGDYFAVDNIVVGSTEVASWTTYTVTEVPFILDDAQHIHPETSYTVQVKGFCDDEETDFCEPITFTTSVTCLPIDSLSFTNLTSTSVNLNWVLLDETQTAWQICLNGDESNLIAANTNENFLLGGLEPETEYTVKVRAVCDANDRSRWSNTITFTTPVSCWPVNSLSYDNLTSFSVNLSWVLEDETQTAWQICLNDNENNLIAANTNEGFLLGNLTPNVEYTVKVRANCGANDYSRWSSTITFTTPEVCATPTDLAVANITAISADLSWIGREDVESYTVRYRTAEGMVAHYIEDFSDNIDSWTMVDCEPGTGIRSGAFAFYRVTDANNPTPHQYLISPELTNFITINSVLEFKYRAYAASYAETFMVGFSNTNNEVDSFTWSDPISANTNVYQTYHASLPVGTKYIAIQCTSYRKYYLFIDDITIGNETIAGQWMTETTAETEAQLINLNGGTPYEAQVKSNCTEDGWSDPVYFSTLINQNEGNHWTPIAEGQYPFSMTLYSVIAIDNVEQTNNQLELGVFCGNECRGTARVSEFFLTQRYLAEVNVYGDSGQEFTFKLYNHAIHQELDLTPPEAITFTIDGYGNPIEPYVMNFTTNAFHFTTAGNWSRASNWSGGTLPGANDAVFIDANCTLNVNASVASLTITEGKTLTLQSGKTLTVTGNLTNTSVTGLVIKDGAQLINTSANVAATVEKNISSHGSASNGWYTIASPMNAMTIAGSNFLTPSYDLYRYNETNLTNNEWENYKTNIQGFTTFEKGRGYLYANSNTITTAFKGTLNASMVTCSLTCTVRPDDPLSGFNLIGNPFPHNIYKGAGGAIDNANLATGYYTLTNEGTWQVHTFEDAIQPGQGILVKATAPTALNIHKSNTVARSERGEAKMGTSRLDISVAGNNGQDRAYVYFDEGIGLEKVKAIAKDAPSLAVRIGNGDFAIAHCDKKSDDVELVFTTPREGAFTIEVNMVAGDFEYLRLIDSATGDNIDLLSALRQAQGPKTHRPASYTFQTSGQEGERHFKLVYKQLEK